jgi:hypothetical protein
MPARIKRNKYRNIPTIVDGIRFPSKRQADRYAQLKLLERAGNIRGLQREVRYALPVGREPICTYVADFTYTERDKGRDRFVVEDVKGVRTEVYKIKRKLMKAIYGHEIRET